MASGESGIWDLRMNAKAQLPPLVDRCNGTHDQVIMLEWKRHNPVDTYLRVGVGRLEPNLAHVGLTSFVFSLLFLLLWACILPYRQH